MLGRSYMQVNTKYERADHSCGRAIFFSPRVFVHQHRANGLVDRVYIGCSRRQSHRVSGNWYYFVSSSSATCFGIRLARRSGEAIGFPTHPTGIRKRSVASADKQCFSVTGFSRSFTHFCTVCRTSAHRTSGECCVDPLRPPDLSGCAI